MKTSSVRPRRRVTLSPPRPRPRTSPRSRASPKSRQVPEKATGTQTRITALTRTLHKTCPEVTIDLDLSSEDGPDVVDLTASTSDPAAVVDLTNDTVLVLDEGESLSLPSFLPSLSSEPSRARTRRDRREKDQPSYVVSSDEEEAAVIETGTSGASASIHRRERTSGVHISCPVCMDSYFEIVDSGRLLVSTRCGHIFCSVCLRDSLSQSHSCPICRKRLPKGHYHPLHL
uniref:RING-type domain-containing protein n=1 Tax=Knipowitschia caucasica TaxID=637954 RepID=A0AAV2MI01_KNICA